jgi:hypothetical protein
MFPALPRPRPRRALAFLLAFLLAPRALAQTPPDAPPPIPVGMNLRPITPFDRAWVFSDAMKLASEWRYADGSQVPRARTRTGGRAAPHDIVPLDANGWPRPTLNRSVMADFFVTMRGLVPVGEYVVTWKGKGTLALSGHVGILSQGPNRIVAQVNGTNGGQPGITLSNIDLTDPIRDIRIWLPGLEETCHSFQPDFLERLRPFSVLRFYPWMRVYTSSGRWSQRTTPADMRQSSGEGVALEYMVELCNELQADPWFCIPHVADDDYVRRFATLVRDSLHHAARIYVEFSNETWNTDFLAGQWAREQGQARGLPAMAVVAERAAQVFDLWHEVFGARKDRIVRVAGVQLHNPGIATILCRHLNGKFDALAVGAYFGCRADRDPVGRDSTAAELMSASRANLDSQTLPRISDHKALCDQYSTQLGRHIPLLTYEGGQSIVPRSPGGGLDLDAAIAVQNMPEMYAAYRALIEGAQARGVELFVGYDFVGGRTAFDTFSVLESMYQPLDQAPKYRALIEGWESRGQ